MRFLLEYAAGGCASCIAEAATLPMDTLKVRCQLLGNRAKFLPTLMMILKKEGVAPLFSGLDAALLRQALYGSMRYGFYPPMQNFFGKGGGHTFIKFIGGGQFTTKLFSGCAAGAIASAICSPTDLVKVRMQGRLKEKKEYDGDVSVGGAYEYKNVFDAFAKVYKNEGVWAMWTGVGPTVLRAAVLAAVEMSMYDTTKVCLAERLQRAPTAPEIHVLAALIASCFSSFASCPFDMARSRVMNQPKDEKGNGLIYGALSIVC